MCLFGRAWTYTSFGTDIHKVKVNVHLLVANVFTKTLEPFGKELQLIESEGAHFLVFVCT